MSTGGGSFACVGVHVGADWTIGCHTYPGTTPILTVGAGPVSVSFSIAARTPVPADGAAFARELARQAARFAADCERLHAADPDGTAADGTAGRDAA